MHYRRLTYGDRIKINIYRRQGKNQAEIARLLRVHRSTISRELRRNLYQGWYTLTKAQRLCEQRKKSRHFPYKLTPVIWSLITERLLLRWSPEQICNRLRLEGQAMVSVETIYQYIYEDRKKGGSWWMCLRQAHRKRRKRMHNKRRKGGRIPNMISISERPQHVQLRKTFGHWERDTMLGKNSTSGVLVLTERKTRFNRFIKLRSRKASQVTYKTIQGLQGMVCKSLTNDRGLEFTDHELCAKKMKVKIYFCDPYASYQRGSNENRIGVLRQYLPKQFNPKSINQNHLNQIAIEINNRPMKIFDWQTPYEIFMKEKNVALTNCS